MTNVTSPTTTRNRTEPTPPAPSTLVIGAAIGAGLALAANVVVHLIGDAGAPTRVVTGWKPDGADLTLVEVTIASIVWVMVGALALWLLERHLTHGFRDWIVLAVVISIASITPLLALDVDAGSKLALSVMHLVVGASAIAGQVLARRSAGGPGGWVLRTRRRAVSTPQTATASTAVKPLAGSPETVGI